MRRRLVTLMLALTICGAAAAETVTAPFPDGSAEAALTARIAETLGYDYAPAEAGAVLSSEGRAEAANVMLAETGTLLCDTQAALMAGLQGYTEEDLRTAMTPVCRVARCPLYLVMSAETAREKGIADGEGLLAYIAENEYADDFLLARHIEADPTDRAAVFLADRLPVLTEPLWPEEIPEALRGGEAALALFTETELSGDDGEWLVLFTLGAERTGARPEIPALPEAGLEACPEPALYLMTAAGTAAEIISAAAERVGKADLSADCAAAGYVFEPLTGEALTAEVAALFADYKEYMTAEGMFFYETD